MSLLAIIPNNSTSFTEYQILSAYVLLWPLHAMVYWLALNTNQSIYVLSKSAESLNCTFSFCLGRHWNIQVLVTILHLSSAFLKSVDYFAHWFPDIVKIIYWILLSACYLWVALALQSWDQIEYLSDHIIELYSITIYTCRHIWLIFLVVTYTYIS